MLIRLYFLFYKNDIGVFTICIHLYMILNYDVSLVDYKSA